MRELFVIVVLLLTSCTSNQLDNDKRIDAAIKLCQSDTTKAYAYSADGLRIMCHDGSSYIIRDDTSLENIVELDNAYCSSMGIREFVSDKGGKNIFKHYMYGKFC